MVARAEVFEGKLFLRPSYGWKTCRRSSDHIEVRHLCSTAPNVIVWPIARAIDLQRQMNELESFPLPTGFAHKVVTEPPTLLLS
jgi:hypothetical protein